MEGQASTQRTTLFSFKLDNQLKGTLQESSTTTGTSMSGIIHAGLQALADRDRIDAMLIRIERTARRRDPATHALALQMILTEVAKLREQLKTWPTFTIDT
jgi:hypothetical protein